MTRPQGGGRRTGEPACWSWPTTRPDRDDTERRFWDGIDTTGYGEKVLELLQEAASALDADRTVLGTWQADRCAVCGRTGHRLVLDHDHATGLVRGWLCVSCNTREGAAFGPGSVFALYRELDAHSDPWPYDPLPRPAHRPARKTRPAQDGRVGRQRLRRPDLTRIEPNTSAPVRPVTPTGAEASEEGVRVPPRRLSDGEVQLPLHGPLGSGAARRPRSSSWMDAPLLRTLSGPNSCSDSLSRAWKFRFSPRFLQGRTATMCAQSPLYSNDSRREFAMRLREGKRGHA
ncbi:endonuclease domain-containing protein [Streptomyces sp. SudanB182_2057]|uniref:endonuclease domain-containing protein n=1 Tax=Streptomyces sp. SudanB182_2057 TaxID=3035281 RepID=UPI003F56F852